MAKRLLLEPPPQSKDVEVLRRYIYQIYQRLGDGPFLIPGFNVATLPNAAEWFRDSITEKYTALIFVNDEAGGSVLAFSDGTNWRRVTDRAIVS